MVSHARPVTPALLQSLSSILSDAGFGVTGARPSDRGVVRFREADTVHTVADEASGTSASIVAADIVTGVRAILVAVRGRDRRLFPWLGWGKARMYDAADLGLPPDSVPEPPVVYATRVPRVHRAIRRDSLSIARPVLEKVAELANMSGATTVLVTGAGPTGSGMAAFLGVDINAGLEGGNRVEVITFGSARLGDDGWRAMMDDIRDSVAVTRVTLPGDVNTSSPPELANYRHVGRQQIVQGARDVKYCAPNTGSEQRASVDAVGILAIVAGLVTVAVSAVLCVPGLVGRTRGAASYADHQRGSHGILLWIALALAAFVGGAFFVGSRSFTAQTYSDDLEIQLRGTAAQSDKQGEDCRRAWPGLVFAQYAGVAILFAAFGVLALEHLGFGLDGLPLARTSFALAGLLTVPAIVALI